MDGSYDRENRGSDYIAHPNRAEVEVARLSRIALVWMLFLTATVTVVFYFILAAFGTAHLLPSTVSVTTSFLAVCLTYLRSPYYALAYAANDIILIVLWVLAAMEDASYFSVVICFTAFLVNDLYGFVRWRGMQQRQESEKIVYHIRKSR